MKPHLLLSAGGIGLLYLLVGSLPLAAMPIAPEKETLATEKLTESQTEISLNTSVENPVEIPGIEELKPADSVEVENTSDRPIAPASELANIPEDSAKGDRLQTAASTPENPPENSLNLAAKPASPEPETLTAEASVINPQTPAIAQTGISAPVPTETSTSQKLAEIENSSSLEPTAANSEASESIELQQVTSVSQLSDVRPTDWAFQALQSLVERYGCIAGYPDGTFRGNRAMTRYEFAAGLNACLDKVTELIKAGTTNLATKEDLTKLQRLQEEFAAELATLRGRVDALEARTSELEANQFSTTTKLSGEAIFSVADTTKNNHRDTETVLNYRLRLNLLTSFTGKDTLITGLQAYNIRSFGPNLGLSTGAFSGLSDSQAKLSFEPQFPGINPQTLSSIDANAIELYKLLYVFPVTNTITLFAGPKAETSDAFQAITPFAGEGQEAISRFAAYNPVVRVSGGTSG
ncbi:iron uptake porin, partial [Tychonema sp. BBK16]